MWVRRATRARFNMTDGSTIEGTVVSRIPWPSYRLTRVSIATPQGAVEASGRFIVPRRQVVFIQALHVDVELETKGEV